MRPELLHIFWLLFNSLITFSYVEGMCEFPESWAGGWFQSGEPQLISINATHIATKGRCLESNGDKFLIHDRSDNCYRCVVIHEKHKNVLQYKETYCDREDELEELCEQITGDATLFSMFRAEAPPSACPFAQPPFTFTYNRGSGECKSPVSRVDSCTDDSRLLLRYQACPDVHGTESTVEELVCLAWWKEGSIRYLVGKVEHSMAHSDEDRYRCFVYEKRRNDGVLVYQLAQSGDATCNGLLSATEGSRTITLTKVTREMSACRYPTWLGEHHTWHTLDHTSTLHASHSNATLRLQSQHHPQPIRLVCHRLITPTSEHYVKLVAHLTTGCDSGYVCLALYRRDSHVLEMQQSQKRTHSADDACLPENFNPSFLPYTTFITGAMKPRPCPHLGLYMLSQTGGDLGGGVGGGEFALASSLGGGESPGSGEGIDGVPDSPQAPPPECGARRFESLAVGCSASDQMEFRSSCVQDSVTAYACHGSWSEDGSSFLIAAPLARKSRGARRYCFAYTPAPGTDSSSPGGGGGSIGGGGVGAPGGGSVLSVTQSCRRRRAGDGPLDVFNTAQSAPLIADHHETWTFNLTAHGQCGSSSQAPLRSPKALWVIVLAFLLSLVHVAQNGRR